MPKSENYVVEFWPKPMEEVKDHEIPYTTSCENAASAIALEARFHDTGWPARALTLMNRVERINLTSNRQEAMTLSFNNAELAFAKGPFAYEYISARDSGKWRIHDSKDNAVGSAESEAEAVDAVRDLNSALVPITSLVSPTL